MELTDDVQYTDSALIDAINEKLSYRKYFDIITQLRPDSTFSLNVMEDGFYELFTVKKDEFKSAVKECLFRQLEKKYADYTNIRYEFRNLKVSLVSHNVLKMHDLRASEHERTLITFDCEVIAVEKPKAYIKEADMYCPLCFNQERIVADYERDITQVMCSNIKCKKEKMIVGKNNLVTSNIQYIYLQELLSEAKNSSPVIMRAILVDELAGRVYVGQKKRVTGLYKSIINIGKTNEHDIVIEVFSAEDLDQQDEICLSPDDIKMLKEASTKDDFTDKLIGSFAPLIIGYKDIKFSILLMLASGYSTSKRSDINGLLVGDPSLAKSELLKEASKLSNKSMYTSGRGASAAGLTIGIVKMDNGTSVAQAGVMPLCNEGLAAIDEFDKMNTYDRSAMHEAMEQQTTSIAKNGFKMTLPAKTTVLAAANPKYGRYDTQESLIDNIDIPVPLISRFDLIWLLRDKVDVYEDTVKAEHILSTFTDKLDTSKSFLTRDQLRSYLAYVKLNYKPELTSEAEKKLVSIYNKMRSLSSNNENLAVGVRQLEALARLSTAHAKLHFRNEANEDDVEVVEGLLKKMYESLGMDMSKTFSQATLVVGKKATKDQTANRVWHDCEDENKSVKYSMFISKLVETGLFDDSSAKSLFSQWEQRCMIKLNGDGTYRKI